MVYLTICAKQIANNIHLVCEIKTIFNTFYYKVGSKWGYDWLQQWWSNIRGMYSNVCQLYELIYFYTSFPIHVSYFLEKNCNQQSLDEIIIAIFNL